MVEMFDYWIFGAVIAAPFVAVVIAAAIYWWRRPHVDRYDYDVD